MKVIFYCNQPDSCDTHFEYDCSTKLGLDALITQLINSGDRICDCDEPCTFKVED